MMRRLHILPTSLLAAIVLIACGDDDGALSIDRFTDTGADQGDAGTDAADTSDDTANPTLDVGTGDDTAEADVDDGAGGSCTDILTCVNTNECATQACLDQCIATGNTEAQGQFNALFQCIAVNCADSLDSQEELTECQFEFCSNELSACTGQQVGTGTATCEEVYTCLLQCTTQECAIECQNTGTAAAQSQAAALSQCAVDACGQSTTEAALFECLEANCGTEYNACYGGGGEGSGEGSAEGSGEEGGM